VISLAVGIALVATAFLVWFAGNVERNEKVRADHVVIFILLFVALIAQVDAAINSPKEVPNVYLNMPCAEKPLTTPSPVITE
jgi:hypothetical protein